MLQVLFGGPEGRSCRAEMRGNKAIHVNAPIKNSIVDADIRTAASFRALAV